MTEEKFILVSLDEEKAKKLADVIGNETSRKILDFLGGVKEASESDISEKLKIPISTVHYNIQHLVKASLVESKEFKWSEKGREINIYRIAKKYVVIAPKGISGLKERLKGVLPLVLFSIIGAGVIHAFFKLRGDVFIGSVEQDTILKAAPATSGVMEAADACMIVQPAVPNYALWFLIGGLFVIIIYLIFKRRR